MDDPDLFSVLDEVYRFYHSEAKFPVKLSEMPPDQDPNSLIRIGNLFEQQLSVSHLSKNDLVLIITDGTHGRNLVDYLYRERVFAPEASGHPPRPGFYYIYPRLSRSQGNNAHISSHRSWLPGGLPSATRHKLLESVVTIDVITDVGFMRSTSIFLVELSDNSSPARIALANNLVDAVMQKRVACILSIFDHRRAKSKDMLSYLGTTLSVIETGHINNLHMFINFTDDSAKESYIEEVHKELESELQKAINASQLSAGELNKSGDREYIMQQIRKRLHPICIPSDVKLLEHLLGASRNQIVPLIANMRNPHFKFPEVDDIDNDAKDSKNENQDDTSMEHLTDILKQASLEKVKFAVDRLEADINHLYNISHGFVRADRNKEITNFIAALQVKLQHVQNWILMFIFTAAFFLHLLSSMKLELGTSDVTQRTSWMSYWITYVRNSYTHKHWLMLYILLIGYYFAVKLLGERFSSIEDIDSDTYKRRKSALRHLELSRIQIKQLRELASHPEKGAPVHLRRRLVNRRLTT